MNTKLRLTSERRRIRALCSEVTKLLATLPKWIVTTGPGASERDRELIDAMQYLGDARAALMQAARLMGPATAKERAQMRELFGSAETSGKAVQS
jgi:hypothetical protein